MNTTSEHEPGLAIWRQVERALEREIASGAFPAGSRLPTEAALAARFHVNRHTLRRAMASLAERGLVRVEQGRGSFVQERVLDYPIGRRTRFSEIVLRQDRRPEGRLLHAGEAPADAAVAKHLGVRKGTPCVVLETSSDVDGLVVGVATHWLPAARFPGLADRYRESGSLTRALESYGVQDYARRSTHLSARLPSAGEAALLRQPRVRPVLVSEGVDIDAGGRPLQYVVTRFAADRVRILVETAGEPDSGRG